MNYVTSDCHDVVSPPLIDVVSATNRPGALFLRATNEGHHTIAELESILKQEELINSGHHLHTGRLRFNMYLMSGPCGIKQIVLDACYLI